MHVGNLAAQCNDATASCFSVAALPHVCYNLNTYRSVPTTAVFNALNIVNESIVQLCNSCAASSTQVCNAVPHTGMLEPNVCYRAPQDLFSVRSVALADDACMPLLHLPRQPSFFTIAGAVSTGMTMAYVVIVVAALIALVVTFRVHRQ